MRDRDDGEDGIPMIPEQSRRAPMIFQNNYGTYSALDRRGRRWLISAHKTGWQLEFLDPGDRTRSYVSTHATLRAAQAEASQAA